MTTDSSLSLSLMGAIAIRHGGKRQKLHLHGQARNLFTFLAAHVNKGRQRDSILNAIWPGTPRARALSALNTAVWRIKRMLDPYESFSIHVIDSLVRLTVAPPAMVDAIVLENAVAEATAASSSSMQLADPLREELACTVAACRGEFIEGCSDAWILSLREHYGSLYIRALSFLMRDEAARQDFEAALTYGRQILTLDPYREGTQREVMWLYALNGQRAQAIRQFDNLKALLNDELGLEPTSYTSELLKRIVAPEENAHDDASSDAFPFRRATDPPPGSGLANLSFPPSVDAARWPR